MVYADTNLFIALANPSDALHAIASKIHKAYSSDLQTSLLTITELLLGCEEYNTDPEVVIGSIFQIADVSGITLDQAMKAAHYMKESKLGAIDALHAALAGEQIISGDKDFDKTDVKRIWAEKSAD